MQRQRYFAGAVVALICLMSASLALAQNTDEKVMATVNGQPITAQYFQDELLRRWGDIGLNSLISQMAIEQAAAEAGIAVTDQELDERVDGFQRNLDLQAPMTGENFSIWLARQKMTPYGFRQWMHTEMLVEKMVQDQATITDEDVRAAYDASKDRMAQPERMRVSHICVTSKEEADRIRAEIIGGKPFEQAAREYSIDPYTKDDGGEFGVITRGDNPFQQAAFTLKSDNELSLPVHTEMGWHIIRRDAYLPAGIPEFDAVKDDIRAQLEKQKLMALMNRKRAEIMRNAHVEYEVAPSELATQ